MYATICARGSYTSYDALPQIYINAVICTEDEHFMTHKGIDPGAIARALLADLRTHSLAEGGSPLTQQLAKNELFTQDKHLARKAAEMLAAFDIERTYSKQQIFEMYANGKTVTESITMMNARNIVTSRGSAFNKNSLRKMLFFLCFFGFFFFFVF